MVRIETDAMDMIGVSDLKIIRNANNFYPNKKKKEEVGSIVPFFLVLQMFQFLRNFVRPFQFLSLFICQL